MPPTTVTIYSPAPLPRIYLQRFGDYLKVTCFGDFNMSCLMPKAKRATGAMTLKERINRYAYRG